MNTNTSSPLSQVVQKVSPLLSSKHESPPTRSETILETLNKCSSKQLDVLEWVAKFHEEGDFEVTSVKLYERLPENQRNQNSSNISEHLGNLSPKRLGDNNLLDRWIIPNAKKTFGYSFISGLSAQDIIQVKKAKGYPLIVLSEHKTPDDPWNDSPISSEKQTPVETSDAIDNVNVDTASQVTVQPSSQTKAEDVQKTNQLSNNQAQQLTEEIVKLAQEVGSCMGDLQRDVEHLKTENQELKQENLNLQESLNQALTRIANLEDKLSQSSFVSAFRAGIYGSATSNGSTNGAKH